MHRRHFSLSRISGSPTGSSGRPISRWVGPDDALEALAEASRLSNGNSKPVSVSAYTLATRGHVSEARAVLADLERLSQGRYVPPCAIALVYAGLNDEDSVFEWLDKALAVRDVHFMYVLVDPKWDPFRQDTRFHELLQRAAL
jgi:hypothetical protein